MSEDWKDLKNKETHKHISILKKQMNTMNRAKYYFNREALHKL